MTNILIGIGLTLWIESGLRGYLISQSRYSQDRIDLEQAWSNVCKQIYSTSNTRFSRSLEWFLEIVCLLLYVLLGPFGWFVGVMNRLQAEEDK